jgi:hypothetical protein
LCGGSACRAAITPRFVQSSGERKDGLWAEDPPSRTRHLTGNLEAPPLENVLHKVNGRRPIVSLFQL